MLRVELPAATATQRIESYIHVLRALMLRDMRTRFGGTMWGYLLQVLWPVAHVVIITAAMASRGMHSPIGSSVLVFVATGAFPALAFQYIGREIMKGVLTNKPLTYYPQVRMFDVMVSRSIVEAIGSFIGLFIIFLMLFALHINPLPENGFEAICGYAAALLLGIGIGTINAAIVVFFPGWMLGFIIVQLALYLTSGVYFLPNFMPEHVYEIMKWNPITQIIEWVRLGYYVDLPVQVDKIYTIMCGLTCLAIGLALNRQIHR